MWQGIVATVVWCLCLVLIKEKPPTPPSASCDNDTTQVGSNIIRVFKNKNAMNLVWTFGLVISFANTYGSIIGIIVNEFGYEDRVSSLFGVVYIVGSIAGAVVFGIIVEIFNNYKSATTIICGMGAISSFFIIISMKIHNVVLACITFFFSGASLAILPVGIDFAVELTYPVAESISTGLLMSMGNFIGLILTLGLGLIIGRYDKNGAWISMLILAIVALLSLVMSCFVKEDLRR